MARKSCVYDPVYTVQSARNYFNTAKRRSCLFRSCENFPPVLRDRLKPQKKRDGENLGPFNDKPVHVDGKHRHLFFRSPVMPFLKPSVPIMRFYSDIDGLEKTLKEAEARCCELPDRTETKETQTDYRESEAQTLPWTPPYRVREDESPEVLTIAHLTWGHGLPAGIHEVEIINRMRMKRAWEAILPPMDNQTNIKTRTMIIEAMEIDDWAFREAEIQFIMDMRMELMEKYTKLKDEAKGKKVSERYERFESLLAERKDQEVRSIRQRLGRELRKLATKHRRGVEDKWWKKCEAVSRTEQIGKNVKNYHEIINRRILKDADVEEKESRIRLPTYSQLKAVRPKPKASELCVRETRWNEEKLRHLHAELKAIRLDLNPEKKSSLMKRRYKIPPMPVTPILFSEAEVKIENKERAAVFIQKLVTGRAVQCVMFEGRDRCRELIEELQSTHWLQSETKKLRQTQKRHVISLQREESRRTLQEDRLSEILNSLEGMTLAGMLDYLSKELVRLKDERKAHAFALLAERERSKREAEEAGRRQMEEQRRREHDEMFRQIVKVNQDSVELYLEDIIKEGIEWISEAQAREYIHQTAVKVDQASRYANENSEDLMQEEMVSDMIYNFVLPDVEKEIVRKRMRQRQTSYLRNAHAAIHKEILDLPEVEETRSSTSESEYLGETEEEERGEAAETLDDESKITKSETSVDWIKRRIIGEIVDPGVTLTESVLEDLIRRSALPASQKIARDLTKDIMKEVEALVENSQLPISGSSGSSYSSESSAKDTDAVTAE